MGCFYTHTHTHPKGPPTSCRFPFKATFSQKQEKDPNPKTHTQTNEGTTSHPQHGCGNRTSRFFNLDLAVRWSLGTCLLAAAILLARAREARIRSLLCLHVHQRIPSSYPFVSVCLTVCVLEVCSGDKYPFGWGGFGWV